LEPAKDLNRESPSKKLECNGAWKELGRETSLPTDDTSLYEITARVGIKNSSEKVYMEFISNRR
jgi:hypothetical protein